MLDLILKGGTIVDGTGRRGYPGDVGIKGGTIVAVSAPGGIGEPAARTIDCTGLVVAPGFVDVHTHYDAQAFWDTTLSPSPLHGVTTVIGGNCGFTIAPLTPEDGPYLMKMLARVEGMPLESLEKGVPWDWRTTAEYLDRLDGTLMPNAGFLVGHSAIRRVAMHDAAVGSLATPDQLEAMKSLLREGLAAGALGFSSTWSPSHNDHEGNPVPSRHSSFEELVELSAVLRGYPGTSLEFLPQVGMFSDDRIQVMAAMSRAADRPLNWNVLQVSGASKAINDQQLSASDYAADHGGKVIALTVPDTIRVRVNLKACFVLDMLQNWPSFAAKADNDKLAMLRDPAGRRRLDEWAQSSPGTSRGLANWASYTVADAFSADTKRFIGRTVGDVAREQDKTPWDALCDIVLDSGLPTPLASADRGQDDVSWQRRVDAWRDPRTLIGASDAGAHLDMIDSFNYATTVLGKAHRERGLLPLEEAVHYLTMVPAALYGLKDRGRLAEGHHADVVVFDPTRIGPGPVYTTFDLPGGAARLTGGASGIEHVFVNGVEVVEGETFTDARPGTLLRAGRDTDTVTASTVTR